MQGFVLPFWVGETHLRAYYGKENRVRDERTRIIKEGKSNCPEGRMKESSCGVTGLIVDESDNETWFPCDYRWRPRRGKSEIKSSSSPHLHLFDLVAEPYLMDVLSAQWARLVSLK